ncbi:MAG: mechanosensitive ion channel [Candidatus Thermoplasmatota archaeon]|nr:mechanosensitive ion channel [Candidatus Thermoplasmatota archaeon]
MPKKHVKKLILITLLFIILSQIIIIVSAENTLPFIGEDDVYDKEIKLGSTGDFYWTVYQNSSHNYAVSVEAKGFDSWDFTVSPTQFILAPDNPYEIVHLQFTVPKYPVIELRTATVSFIFRELNSSVKYSIEKTVTVTIIGFSYIGEENTLVGGFSNPLPAPLNTPYGAFLINIFIWFFLAIIIYLLIKYVLRSIAKKTKTDLDDAIIEILRRPTIILILIYGAITSFLRMGISIGLKESLYQIFNAIILGIGIYVFYKIYNEILEDISKRRGGKKSTFARVLKPVFRKIGAVVIIIGGLIYGLSVIGVEITALLAGAGVFGLVIAFAAQDTLSNFFSGIHLLLDRPFQMGDIILLEGGEYCRVENVGMRSTRLYSIFDHQLIILPNNNIANQKIVNIVKPDMRIRKKIEVGVAYGSDVEKVKKILYDVAIQHPNVIKEEEMIPLVRFNNFGESSLDFRLIFTVDDVMNQWQVKSEIITEIDAQFRKANITIPFPQRTLWLNEIKNPKK